MTGETAPRTAAPPQPASAQRRDSQTSWRRAAAALRPRRPEVTRRGLALTGVWLVLWLVAAVGTLSTQPVLRAAGALFLLVLLPTVLLAAKTRRDQPVVHRVYLAHATAVLAWIVLTLLLNTIAHALGVDRPLSDANLRVLVLLPTLLLVVVRPGLNPPVPVVRVLRWTVRGLPVAHVPILIGLLTLAFVVGGAVVLNNGGSENLAMIGLALTAVTAVLAIGTNGSEGRNALAVLLVALALLLGTSLRDWHLIGHDIFQEFYYFQLTDVARFWDIRADDNAYNACLSVTLFPTLLHALTGISPVWLFKLVLPVLFAPVSVGVYAAVRRYAPAHLAVLAAILMMAFPTFIIDLPYLLRQGMAFLFVAGFLLVASGTGRSQRLIRSEAVLMGLGVVLCHYSTTYVLAMTLLVAAGLRLAFRIGTWAFRGRTLKDPLSFSDVSLLHPTVVVTVTAAAVVWAGPVTNSGGHLRDVMAEVARAMVTGEASGQASEMRRALFAPPQPPQDKLDKYSEEVLDGADSAAPGTFLRTTVEERFPRIKDLPDVPPTALGDAVDDAGMDTLTFTNLMRQLSGMLLQLLTAIGLALLVFRRRVFAQMPEDVRWYSVGSAIVVVAFIVGPGLSTEYGFLRSLQQALLVWGGLAAITLGVISRRHRVGRVLAMVLAAVMLLNISGWTSRLVGGYSPQLNVANAGFYWSIYGVNDGESRGADWVVAYAEKQRRAYENFDPTVWTDRSSIQRILNARLASQGREDDLSVGVTYPSVLPRRQLVFIGTLAARDNVSTRFIGGDILSYEFPTKILDEQKVRIYSNGYSTVYGLGRSPAAE